MLAVVIVVLLQGKMLWQYPGPALSQLDQLFQIWAPCWSYLLSAIQEQTTTHCRFYREQHWTPHLLGPILTVPIIFFLLSGNQTNLYLQSPTPVTQYTHLHDVLFVTLNSSLLELKYHLLIKLSMTTPNLRFFFH